MPVAGYPQQRYLISVRGLRERPGAATLIDQRPAEHFALGHIAGSKHLDIYGASLNDCSAAPLNWKHGGNVKRVKITARKRTAH